MQKQYYKISWNYVWLSLFAIGIGIFLMVTPKYYDDYWYMWDFNWWYNQQGIWYPTEGGNIFKYGIPWESLFHTIRYHVEEDNMRAANMFGPFMLLFPKWVGSLVSLVSVIITIFLIFKLAKVDISRSWLMSICIGMWTWTMLWHDYMGTVIYQYNYLLSGAIYLGLVYLLFKHKMGIGKRIGFILLCILGAVWHEGFTIPLVSSLVIVVIFFKDSRNWKIYTAIVILALGLIWHFGGVSTRSRMVDTWLGISWRLVLTHLFYHKAIIIALIVSIIFIWKKGIKIYLNDRLRVLLISGIIVAFGQAYYTDISRSAWWADVASILLTLQLLRQLDGTPRKGYRGWRGIFSASILILSYALLVAVDIFTIKFAREYPKIIKEYIENPPGYQYSELLDYKWNNLFFLQFNTQEIFRLPSFISWYYGYDNDKRKRQYVVPSELRNVTLDKCEPIAGNTNLMKYGRYMVAPVDTIEDYYIFSIIDYGWFKTGDRWIKAVPFTSEGDGQRYVYAFPYIKMTEYKLGNVKNVFDKNKDYREKQALQEKEALKDKE